MTYTANVVHENLATKDVKLGLNLFNEHLNREGIGLRVVHVDDNKVVYEPFIISHEAPISLKTIDGKVTTLKLSMHVHRLPSREKESILGEARFMSSTGKVFVVDKKYCSILGLQEIHFTPNIGEAYYKVTRHGTFMPHRYPVPKRCALKISRTIEDSTVDYIMSLDDSYPTREEALDSGEYGLASYKLFDDIKTPHTCFITPKGHTECAFDLYHDEAGTLFSSVPLTGAEQEQIYEGIVNYIKTSVAEAHDKAFEEWEASLRYGF